jgi:Reverse transcriptase (RNA-dependent DNA polymerase).
VTAKGLIPKQQFGFSKGYFATHQLLRLTEYILQEFHLKQSTVVVFLYVSKTYDTICNTGLLYKLLKMEIPLGLVKLIQSFLAQIPFRVRMDGARSNWKPMPADVP